MWINITFHNIIDKNIKMYSLCKLNYDNNNYIYLEKEIIKTIIITNNNKN